MCNTEDTFPVQLKHVPLYCTALHYTVLIVSNVRLQDGLSAGLSHDGGIGLFGSGSAPYRFARCALFEHFFDHFLSTAELHTQDILSLNVLYIQAN